MGSISTTLPPFLRAIDEPEHIPGDMRLVNWLVIHYAKASYSMGVLETGYVQRYPCKCQGDGHDTCWILCHPSVKPPISYPSHEEAEHELVRLVMAEVMGDEHVVRFPAKWCCATDAIGATSGMDGDEVGDEWVVEPGWYEIAREAVISCG